MNTKPAPYASLHAGRAMAALLIVVHHAALAISTAPNAWQQPGVFQAFQGLAFAVEFFFVLSGIVMMLAHVRDFGNPATLSSYAWKRFRRVYPIYWIVAAAWIVIYVGFGRNINPLAKDPSTLISSVLLIHIGSLGTALTVGWTLFHEVLFYLLFAGVLIHKHIGKWVLFAWMCASLFVTPFSSNPWLVDYFFSPLHILFGYGMGAAWLVQHNRLAYPRALFWGGASAFSACIVYAVWGGFTNRWIEQLAGLSAAAAAMGLMHMERNGGLRVPPFLIFLGDASYSIYLVHMPVNVILQKALYRLDVRFHLGIPFCMLVFFLAGAGIGCVCHVFLEQPLLRQLSGYRKRPAAVLSSH